jgi:transposase
VRHYSHERKEAVLKKMLPPHSRSIPKLAEEEGISVGTLYLVEKAGARAGTAVAGWGQRC